MRDGSLDARKTLLGPYDYVLQLFIMKMASSRLSCMHDERRQETCSRHQSKRKRQRMSFIDLYRQWEKGMYILNAWVISEILDSPDGV